MKQVVLGIFFFILMVLLDSCCRCCQSEKWYRHFGDDTPWRVENGTSKP